MFLSRVPDESGSEPGGKYDQRPIEQAGLKRRNRRGPDTEDRQARCAGCYDKRGHGAHNPDCQNDGKQVQDGNGESKGEENIENEDGGHQPGNDVALHHAL